MAQRLTVGFAAKYTNLVDAETADQVSGIEVRTKLFVDRCAVILHASGVPRWGKIGNDANAFGGGDVGAWKSVLCLSLTYPLPVVVAWLRLELYPEFLTEPAQFVESLDPVHRCVVRIGPRVV